MDWNDKAGGDYRTVLFGLMISRFLLQTGDDHLVNTQTVIFVERLIHISQQVQTEFLSGKWSTAPCEVARRFVCKYMPVERDFSQKLSPNNEIGELVQNSVT